MFDNLIIQDDSEIWLEEVIGEHYEEALSRATSLIEAATKDENGCLVTVTRVPRRVKFRGHQLPAYRFIHCVLERAVIGGDEVVRHRCHNRLCVNPEHLELGSRADNKRDDRDNWANGVDFDYL